MTARNITIKDVAAAAGVGVSTVSRVVNGERYVNPATRERVQAAIHALGFRPNLAARNLRPGRRSETIALLIEDIANPFSAGITHGVEEVATARGDLVTIGVTGRSFPLEQNLVTEMLRRNVDGLLVVPAPGDHRPVAVETGDVPLVFLDREPQGVESDVVLLANLDGARGAVEDLLSSGHRRIAYLGGDVTAEPGSERWAGYRSALADAGIPVDPRLVSVDHMTVASAADAVRGILRTAEPPTALFADNNRMTLAALTGAGRTAPPTIAGFDDFELAPLVESPLTLVTYDAAELGRSAARLLYDRIDGSTGPARRVVIPTHLRRA
ncbi:MULTISPECIES: LacI family DNA-binding transcriptional regulator [unclassified Actinotalea]|uniref:LacI family DNA-binding transcriptional regulator n=1 Tax=unclassified Actinotalea TaxID=2638618 RepID=UPI0015F5EDFE|nr:MULTISPECIES: LacI family DNA-binding transcriptional regulator [unclassified Actinotalea]